MKLDTQAGPELPHLHVMCFEKSLQVILNVSRQWYRIGHCIAAKQQIILEVTYQFKMVMGQCIQHFSKMVYLIFWTRYTLLLFELCYKSCKMRKVMNIFLTTLMIASLFFNRYLYTICNFINVPTSSFACQLFHAMRLYKIVMRYGGKIYMHVY